MRLHSTKRLCACANFFCCCYNMTVHAYGCFFQWDCTATNASAHARSRDNSRAEGTSCLAFSRFHGLRPCRAESAEALSCFVKLHPLTPPLASAAGYAKPCREGKTRNEIRRRREAGQVEQWFSLAASRPYRHGAREFTSVDPPNRRPRTLETAFVRHRKFNY